MPMPFAWRRVRRPDDVYLSLHDELTTLQNVSVLLLPCTGRMKRCRCGLVPEFFDSHHGGLAQMVERSLSM